MSRFIDDAANLMNAAENVVHTGQPLSDMTILISAEGGIHMIAGSDWPLDSLQSHHGARTAYRILRQHDRVRVEGRESGRTVSLESEEPNRAARAILGPSHRHPYLELAAAPPRIGSAAA